MSFLEELEKTTNVGYTANGAVSNISTLDPLLDLFSKGGTMRDEKAKLLNLFAKAYASDKLGAVRCMFYLRDVRGGQGERDIFRVLLSGLEGLDRNAYEKVLSFVPEYGRWDDLFTYDVDEVTATLVKEQLAEDEENMKAGKSVSLMAKWLPSENASSKKSRDKAVKLAELLDIKPSQYRKRVTALRKHIELLEHKMSDKEWEQIEYGKLPAQAHRKHIGAFRRHDESRYDKYLESVEKGEAKINSGTLFAYEIYEMVDSYDDSKERSANAMWANLPDYTNGKNALVVADVSGSMSGRPMAISVSLALYFAERNKGAFKDYFMTFSENSRLQKVNGSTLSEKMRNIENAEWGMSTNIQSAFNAILKAAINANSTADEIPSTLYIISDMQFNEADRRGSTNFEEAKRKFNEAGYELPHIVFWNCSPYGNDSPATKYDENVTLISGANQSTFQYVLEGKTPIQSMLDILNSDRYNSIQI